MKLTNELVNVFAHLYGDGCFKKYDTHYIMAYTNTEYNLVEEFRDNLKKVINNSKYKLNIRKQKSKNVRHKDIYCIKMSSIHLSNYYDLFDNLEVLKLIKTKEHKRIFLMAFFDDEGSVSKEGVISICNLNKKLLNTAKCFLIDLGIKKITNYNVFNKIYQKYYYYLRISKIDNKKFKKLVGFNHIKKKRLEEEGRLKIKNISMTVLKQIKGGLTQLNIFLDDKENNKVMRCKEKWGLSSKVDTIRKIIGGFEI